MLRSSAVVVREPSSCSISCVRVALTAGGYLHLVSLRPHCCCYELRAVSRAYSYLLLVKNSKRQHRRTYIVIPLIPFCWLSRSQEKLLSSSDTACDTNEHVRTVVRRKNKARNSVSPATLPLENALFYF